MQLDKEGNATSTPEGQASVLVVHRHHVLGLVIGGGWRSLLPRRTDLRDAMKMFCYYIGIPLAKLTRRSWLHPRFNTKYNALQRVVYFSIPVAALLSVATAWAIHKPMEL
jgi:thiosulfate reductase cytochrome b subunit